MEAEAVRCAAARLGGKQANPTSAATAAPRARPCNLKGTRGLAKSLKGIPDCI
jgi:hypothetical protein